MKKKGFEIPRASVGARWIGIRITDGMRGDLKAIALKESRTLSNVVRLALAAFIDDYGKASRKIKG